MGDGKSSSKFKLDPMSLLLPHERAAMMGPPQVPVKAASSGAETYNAMYHQPAPAATTQAVQTREYIRCNTSFLFLWRHSQDVTLECLCAVPL
jgi:hypothetical protein